LPFGSRVIWPALAPPLRAARHVTGVVSMSRWRVMEVTMKTIFAATLATLLAWLACGAALAADLGVKAAPLGGYRWQGFYLGGNLGYQWGAITNNAADPSGFMGGLQVGYNWQSGQFVFGAETDLQLSGADDTAAARKFSNPWFGTLRGRVGYAFNNILLYGTLGLAYGRIRLENTTSGASEAQLHGGWTAGLGMEVGLGRSWSAKAEYLYLDFSDRNYTITGMSHGMGSSLLRFGANYRF